ncbi:MAG: Asp23/Gls24 family envelope stress response protein [Oscillospiraceae bacterium]|nr:Asp23/Gls24 family envelope stress response protein [Oscillospiraceae bacterium]
MGDNYISCKAENGSINISEEVISTMVRTAITEIDGVAGISNTAGAELAELIGIKTVSKGIKVQIVDDTIKVDAIILVRYGCNIVNVAKEVQNSVTEAVQAITGIDKAEVNVHVSGVAFEK